MSMTLHSQFLELLFIHQKTVNQAFKDVLGLHDINHMALTYVNNNQQIMSLSSTPSLEFNLFSTDLWPFDNTYQPGWYELCTSSPWQALYAPDHYQALYDLKQLKHRYLLGLSFAEKLEDGHMIYSIASHKDTPDTRDLFATQQEAFYRIGQYCRHLLLPIFQSKKAVESATSF